MKSLRLRPSEALLVDDAPDNLRWELTDEDRQEVQAHPGLELPGQGDAVRPAGHRARGAWTAGAVCQLASDANGSEPAVQKTFGWKPRKSDEEEFLAGTLALRRSARPCSRQTRA